MGRLALTLMVGDYIDLDTASGPIRLTLGRVRSGQNGGVALCFEAPESVGIIRGRALAKTAALRGQVIGEGDSDE